VNTAPRLKLAQSQTLNNGVQHLPFALNKNFTLLNMENKTIESCHAIKLFESQISGLCL